MRGIALGRKNWIQIGSESSGPKIAALLSVLETCKRLKINVREYLLDVLPQLAYRETRPELRDLNPVADLTPEACSPAPRRPSRARLLGAGPTSEGAVVESGRVAHPFTLSQPAAPGEMQLARRIPR